MELRNYRVAILTVFLSLMLGMGLYSANAVRASAGKAGDRPAPGSHKADKDSRKKKEPAGKEAKDPDEMTAEEFEASLNFQQGKVTIKEGLATLDVPKGFRYLNPEQSQLILVKAWGNPPEARRWGCCFRVISVR